MDIRAHTHYSEEEFFPFTVTAFHEDEGLSMLPLYEEALEEAVKEDPRFPLIDVLCNELLEYMHGTPDNLQDGLLSLSLTWFDFHLLLFTPPEVDDGGMITNSNRYYNAHAWRFYESDEIRAWLLYNRRIRELFRERVRACLSLQHLALFKIEYSDLATLPPHLYLEKDVIYQELRKTWRKEDAIATFWEKFGVETDLPFYGPGF